MGDQVIAVASQTKKMRSRKFRKNIFIITLLAYPILHFAICWIYINSKAVALTFTTYIPKEKRYMILAGDLFYQYRMWIKNFIAVPEHRQMLLTSFIYFPVTCFISLPLSLLFAYFLFKKMPIANAFRVIFYLPSILPVVVMAMAFRSAFDTSRGFINPLIHMIFPNAELPLWWGSDTVTPMMVYIYCIWAGLGFNIVIFSGAMSRVPHDLLEYNRLEGVGMFRELVQIMTPLIWPTITTAFVLGMSSVLTVFMQPYFLTMSQQGPFNTRTIYMFIFSKYNFEKDVPQLAALGILCSVIYVPVILSVRYGMNKMFADVDY